MKLIRGVRSHATRRLGVMAVAGVAGLALTGAGQAAESPTASAKDAAVSAGATSSSETVNVTGTRQRAESPKYTAPLLDTPQTITVIDAGVIRGQNMLTLREILSTAPGITFGAGEGGGGYGDSINLRGYAANSDITVDGVRDSAQYTRTDPFNLEQIELTNGANSVYGGSGSLGGTINIVSKTPHGNNAGTVTAGIGTDNYYRGTVDADYEVAENTAIRFNAMGHSNDVPGRDVETYERWAVAPSVAFGLNTDTVVTLSYLHQEDRNTPQYGVPYYRVDYFEPGTFNRIGGNAGPVPGVDPSNYYGYANIDRQDADVDQFTFKIEHDFNDWMSVRNLTRYQEVSQVTVVDPPQGTWCLADGTNVATNLPCPGAGSGLPALAPGYYRLGGPRGNRRDTENTLFYSQTDFSAEFETGGIKHTMVLGFSISSEDYHLETGNALRNADGTTLAPNGTTFVAPDMSISDPYHYWDGPTNYLRTGVSDGELKSRAVYIFDTIEFNETWELSGGLRYETVEGEFTAAALPAAGQPGATPPYTTLEPPLVQGPVFRNEESLLSYRVGLVYKPVSNATFYIAYGNTETPSQASVNGGCNAATCDVDAEEGQVYEAGVKWNVFDNRLALSAAIFRNERTAYKVPSNDPAVPDQQTDGSSRVTGLSLSATGNVTDELTIFANYTYLDTEVIQGVSDFCEDQPLTNTACYGPTIAYKGNPLTNTPEHSGSFWLTYELPYGVTVGYGATYQGEFYLNNGITVVNGVGRNVLYMSDSYWVHSAMVNYAVNEDFGLQLNVKNLTDEEYYVRIRNNGWALPGDGLSATLTASYTF